MSPTPFKDALTASEHTLRWDVTHPRKHWILHASELKPRTWENCIRFLVLYLTTLAKTASGSWSVPQLYRRTLYVLQVFGSHLSQLPHMLNGVDESNDGSSKFGSESDDQEEDKDDDFEA